MKKRFVCALLALVLLVGLVPVTASAANHSVSAAAITVLKQLTTFKSTCYYVSGSEYRTGYGTVCTQKHHFNTDGTPKASENVHTITQAQADTALRTYLAELDKKVNSFASQNGLSLTQNQHDALVVFSHGAGTAWMSGTGALKSAIVTKAGTNELLNVMKSLNDGNFKRHQVEVNMYVNGVYTNTIPASFDKVTYNANGGKIAKGNGTTYTMQFDSSKTIDHISATNSGQIFLGWYIGSADGKWMPKLNADCVDADENPDKTLYAYWQDGYNNGDNAVEVSYTLKPSNLVSTTMYESPIAKPVAMKDAKKKTYTVASEVEVELDYISENGTRWAYVYNAEKGVEGWVKVGTPKADAVGSNVIATATVSYNGYLNVRNIAGTDGKIVGALAKNETVDIYEIQTVNGHRWGKCDAGWICLTYTTLTMLDGKTVSDGGITAYAFTGKTTGEVKAYVAPGDMSDPVAFKDAKKNVYDSIPADTAITIANLSIAEYGGEKATWAKATWKNPERDKNDKEIKVTRSAWVPISKAGTALGDESNYYVALDPVKFTVVSDTTNVREAAGDAATLAFTLDKGTEVEINRIRLVGENIWGKMTILDPVLSSKLGKTTGWINLATKYVKRSSEVTIDSDGSHDTGLIATVINTDRVKVRKTGALYGAVIGSLSRGTTVQVWESKKDEWYKIDTNQNGVYDYSGDGWVSAQYLNVRAGSLGGSQTITDASGNTVTTDGTGTGVVANTYSGVNVRQGAGIGYAIVGKLLPGTTVQIQEVKQGGAAKWGRTDKGWVCMDYISMVSYNPSSTSDPSKGTGVGSLDEVAKTTTTAVYTGKTTTSCSILKEPIVYDAAETELIAANTVRAVDAGTNVTIHELAAVTQKVKSDKEGDAENQTVTTVTTTTYWARVNDGWIQNPETCLELNALDEKIHTLTGADTLKVRADASQEAAKVTVLEKGDQVSVTALKINDDKVWGRIETEKGTGWIRLDYMSEGAYYVNQTPSNGSSSTTTPVMGSTGNTGTGGFVTNSSGYKYKGKVINTNSLNVRASASTSASVTTTLKSGAALVIYETTISENMAWGRCDAGWVYLYYVDLTPCVNGAVDARVVYNDNTVAYSDVNCTTATGTYARMSVVDIYEIVGKMAKTDLGWVNTDNLL